jgi:hypothetical protein
LSPDFSLEHYFPDAKIVNAPLWGSSRQFLLQVLSQDDDIFVENWPALISNLKSEGVLRFIGNALLSRSLDIPQEVQQELKNELLKGEAEKLTDDQELASIFKAANEIDLAILLIKGEALARTLYPAAGCRPTGDYDMLILPADLSAFQALFSKLGYTGGTFSGSHLFGQQAWTRASKSQGRTYLVDLHWDISNRRFFRNRAELGSLFEQSVKVPSVSSYCRVPSPQHNLLIACVHLAADDLSEPLRLLWLLDIQLLLDAIPEREFGNLLDDAQRWKLADALVFYCSVADATLGPVRHREVIQTLSKKMSYARRRAYRWSCNTRLFDLLEYGLRLGNFGERRVFHSQVLEYWKDKRKSKNQ